MRDKHLKNLRIFLLALILCLLAIPISRFFSPRAIVDGHDVYLAWLPLSVMLAVILLFGRRAIAPVILGFALTNALSLELTFVQALALLFCQVFSVFASCGVVRWQLGRRWRHGLPNKYIGIRLFWLGFVLPLGIKFSMYLVGHLVHYPVSLSNFFGEGSAIYNVIDIQSLICAALIFTMMFYYPFRMIVNPRYARRFWQQWLKPCLAKGNAVFTFGWVMCLAIILLGLCAPFDSDYIAGYLVPVIFILFTMGISRLSYALVSLCWAVSVFLLLTYNVNFLNGVQTGYSLAIVLSVLISFAICLMYMSRIYQHGEWLKQGWQERALTDPLTGLPNMRALEAYLEKYPETHICCLRMNNLEFLSRHYGMMMRVHCKREITTALKPFLLTNEKLFQLPGSELVLVLNGTEIEARLQHLIDLLNNRKIYWNNTPLDIEFGASWGHLDRNNGENLHHTLGQLSWLSEQSCATQTVLALTNSLATVSGHTSERVFMLSRVKRALQEGGIRLYAQPILNAAGIGYHEILTRLESDGEIITPDRFIPLIAQFNLSRRFDLSVVEALVKWMAENDVLQEQARFSVNLMPLTLMQKEVGTEIIHLFEAYGISSRTVIIEVTEEQAFSNSETSIHNIQQLREYGFKIAIDDFGTGYANYERLKRLQADIIKIDGCFVKDICTDSMDAMIVQSICNLAKTKSLCVVAEFVETEEQRRMLLASGVNYLQGYLIGKPRPLDDIQA
jgi:EAL domain-containing protein (putative c-di-GMP-specific phosphodiesterase class I)/GGDEF domain-containing protein